MSYYNNPFSEGTQSLKIKNGKIPNNATGSSDHDFFGTDHARDSCLGEAAGIADARY